ncbi:hypothetical protein, partial [Blautia wexlerae]|uniref:hypothetical protein n=1 Tax=Blautia wexlerae TaxID=418240 RepID=UPI0019650B5D
GIIYFTSYRNRVRMNSIGRFIVRRPQTPDMFHNTQTVKKNERLDSPQQYRLLIFSDNWRITLGNLRG